MSGQSPTVVSRARHDARRLYRGLVVVRSTTVERGQRMRAAQRRALRIDFGQTSGRRLISKKLVCSSNRTQVSQQGVGVK